LEGGDAQQPASMPPRARGRSQPAPHRGRRALGAGAGPQLVGQGQRAGDAGHPGAHRPHRPTPQEGLIYIPTSL
jgi:hypothetical protein